MSTLNSIVGRFAQDRAGEGCKKRAHLRIPPGARRPLGTSAFAAAFGGNQEDVRRFRYGERDPTVGYGMREAVIVASSRTALAKSFRGSFNLTGPEEPAAHVIDESLVTTEQPNPREL